MTQEETPKKNISKSTLATICFLLLSTFLWSYYRSPQHFVSKFGVTIPKEMKIESDQEFWGGFLGNGNRLVKLRTKHGLSISNLCNSLGLKAIDKNNKISFQGIEFKEGCFNIEKAGHEKRITIAAQNRIYLYLEIN